MTKSSMRKKQRFRKKFREENGFTHILEHGTDFRATQNQKAANEDFALQFYKVVGGEKSNKFHFKFPPLPVPNPIGENFWNLEDELTYPEPSNTLQVNFIPRDFKQKSKHLKS